MGRRKCWVWRKRKQKMQFLKHPSQDDSLLLELVLYGVFHLSHLPPCLWPCVLVKDAESWHFLPSIFPSFLPFFRMKFAYRMKFEKRFLNSAYLLYGSLWLILSSIIVRGIVFLFFVLLCLYSWFILVFSEKSRMSWTLWNIHSNCLKLDLKKHKYLFFIKFNSHL